MRTIQRLAAGAATTAIALAWLQAAEAQTTATQAGEVVVTGSRQTPNVGGVVSQVQDAKDESIVTQELFQHETPGANAGQLINLIPGVNFVTEDPTGLGNGDLRIHGQSSNLVSVLLDGVPLNDTGNYAVYVGEYVVPEITDHISVNLGATDVDSPSAAATAGTVNIDTKLPAVNAGAIAQYSAGDFNYQRLYGELDSGSAGPFGTRGFVAYNMLDSDKYRGSGDARRMGVDGKIYQPLGGPDFASVAFTYVQNRVDPYYSFSKAQLAEYGRQADYSQLYVNPTATPGKANLPPSQTQYGNSDQYYYALRDNPTNFGIIHGQSYLDLTHGFHLTFDPYFQFIRSNGGGVTAVSEKDARLTDGGKYPNGVDLNGDGDTLDTVNLYTPSDTETHRYGVNTSLLFDPDLHDHFQLTYSLDYGRHRQTGPATFINGGQPDNVFGGTDGFGPPVLSPDGSQFETRNRYSIATLNQFAFNYIGKYLDDRLHVNLGVRDPFFIRHLNQYCYNYNGTSAQCVDVSPTTVQGLINSATANNGAQEAAYAKQINSLLGLTPSFNAATDTLNLRVPYTQRFSYSKPLPNVGATYRLFDHNLFYVQYAESFSAPITDDLYVSSSDLVKPQTSTEYGAGYRYESPRVIASVDPYYELYRNRIVSSPDPLDPTITDDRNIGKVDIYGVDGQVGVHLFDHLASYLSASYIHTKVVGNEQGFTSNVVYEIPTNGKELVDTPQYTIAERVQYSVGPFEVGLQGKYMSYRYTTDTNDDRSPGFATFDLDSRLNLNIMGYRGAYFQVNITNLFDRYYLARFSTATNAQAFTFNGVHVSAATPYFYVGAPRYAIVTLHAAF